ncbi:hypothetical protein ACWELQ_42980, partial [Nocardia sp. NPDC004722]
MAASNSSLLAAAPKSAPEAPRTSGRSQYSLVVSSDAEHREAAQRLRYQVFANEPGFTIPDNGTGLD